MIPTENISIDGDTAWVTFKFGTGFNGEAWEELDRPCDTCAIRPTTWLKGFVDIGGGYGWSVCPDCHGTGRHVFDIEVEHHDAAYVTYQTSEPTIRTLRVHVVSDMVLPIVSCYDDEGNHDDEGVPGTIEWVDEGFSAYLWTDEGPISITLPSAARPGMWAVQLKVLS